MTIVEIQVLGHLGERNHASDNYLGKAELVTVGADDFTSWDVRALFQLNRTWSLEVGMPKVLWELCSSHVLPSVTQNKYHKTAIQSQVILDKSPNRIEELYF